jgi:site-specific DNA-adenine methylase
MCAYYHGGKKRIGKHIADAIRAKSSHRKTYMEPFCGMLGVFRHIHPEEFDTIHLADRNPAIIKMWEAAKNGWEAPQSCSKKRYLKMKHSKAVLTPDAIFCGFACSMRGSLFSTFVDVNNIKHQSDHIKEISKFLLENVYLTSGDYRDTIPPNTEGAVLYLDPPYKGTTNKFQINRVHNSHFDYDSFLEWAVKMSANNDVYISEQTNLPPPAQLIWGKGKEKLYKL